MEIREITQHKKQYFDLLYLADEQEDMIDRYLERGTLFALYEENQLKAVSVVTLEGEGVCEIKNIATYPAEQRKGYGKRLVTFLFEYYKPSCTTMLVGTGDFPSTLLFYEHCGFTISHRVENFFIDHYDHPIYEEGEQLIDMVYLKKTLR
ncbi:GNAT family N-acetyltransferase [Bacteroides reticulotermitis]|uniref:GNAT family N-acetyltransferase n=1 Tax=Bacteroides reticulotermitis TaxID=1133319 RepID=UPI001D7D95AE|nr:GNAT family N-acetyltransferase [Bacteroides reticulotermitis]